MALTVAARPATAETRTTRDGQRYYCSCPVCGSGLSWRERERNGTHEPRAACHECGFTEWLSVMDREIRTAHV